MANKYLLYVLFSILGVSLFSCSNSSNVASSVATSLKYPNLKSFYYEYKVHKALKEKKYEEALDYNLKMLELEPYSIEAQSNLAIIYDFLTKKDEAQSTFDFTEKKLSEYKDYISLEKQFSLYYNLGVFYGAQKKTEQALKFYQKALDIYPPSIETKHNIELLIQQQQQQQQQQKNGEGQDNQDQNKDDKNKDSKDQKDKDQKDKDSKDDQDQKNQEQKNKQYKQSPKYQPRSYKGEKLSEGDVKKILGELSQQDKKIRSQYNQKNQQRPEVPNAKDW